MPDTLSRTYAMRDLIREFDVTARALRFYEDKGLLAPARNGQSRVFSERDRKRLRWIVRGKSVGFSLVEIREMLELLERKDDGGLAKLTVWRAKFREQIETLKRQRHDIDMALETLETGCAWIDEQLDGLDTDTLPQAETYEAAFRDRLDGAAHPPHA